MQSLTIGGPWAGNCDDGCIVTTVTSGSYILTNNDGIADPYGGGAFDIVGSTLTWANGAVYTKDACPQGRNVHSIFFHLQCVAI